jgi:putative hydrolase of the HAD superfamily
VTLPTRLRAVFLDVGGPIYDDENYVSAVRTALAQMRAEDGRAPVDEAEFRAIYDSIRDQQGGSLRSALARELLGDQSRRGELHQRTRQHWVHPQGTLYPDVQPFLAALHGSVRIGVLANQEAVVVDALRRDGIADYIDVWGVSALVGYEKPSPELFGWALAEAGTDATAAVHIGNRLDTDVRPAKALGLGTVWVTRGEAPDAPTTEQRAEPDLVVPSLDGLADVLLALVEGRS